MSKLPNIFHTNDKYYTNNKNTFCSFNNNSKILNNEDKVIENNLISYFNREVNITLKNGDIFSGILISKIGNKILLDTGVYILINEIIDIK